MSLSIESVKKFMNDSGLFCCAPKPFPGSSAVYTSKCVKVSDIAALIEWDEDRVIDTLATQRGVNDDIPYDMFFGRDYAFVMNSPGGQEEFTSLERFYALLQDEGQIDMFVGNFLAFNFD